MFDPGDGIADPDRRRASSPPLRSRPEFRDLRDDTGGRPMNEAGHYPGSLVNTISGGISDFMNDAGEMIDEDWSLG